MQCALPIGDYRAVVLPEGSEDRLSLLQDYLKDFDEEGDKGFSLR